MAPGLSYPGQAVLGAVCDAHRRRKLAVMAAVILSTVDDHDVIDGVPGPWCDQAQMLAGCAAAPQHLFGALAGHRYIGGAQGVPHAAAGSARPDRGSASSPTGRPRQGRTRMQMRARLSSDDQACLRVPGRMLRHIRRSSAAAGAVRVYAAGAFRATVRDREATPLHGRSAPRLRTAGRLVPRAQAPHLRENRVSIAVPVEFVARRLSRRSCWPTPGRLGWCRCRSVRTREPPRRSGPDWRACRWLLR
jgi:hypothetical protein